MGGGNFITRTLRYLSMILLGPPPKIPLPSAYSSSGSTRDFVYNYQSAGKHLPLPIQICEISFSHLNVDEHGQPASFESTKGVHTPGMKERYVEMCGLISICASSAEDINRALYDLDKWIEFTAEDISKGKKPRDFMGMKDSFLAYAKKNPATAHLVPKAIRSAFNYFILYRNIFTHGKLMILMPSGGFCIKYLDNETKKSAYMLVTEDLLATFIATHQAFQHVVSEVKFSPHTPAV